MKTTIRQNITEIPYSLHDAVVVKLCAESKKLTLHFENGYVQAMEPYDDVTGTVEFAGVDWDCSFACVYKCKEFSLENTGALEGVDETFGYNQTRLEGYLYRGADTYECSIGVYHMGDMSYVTEEEE